MSKLSESLKKAGQRAELALDALDRAITENEAALSTAELAARKMDVTLDKAAEELKNSRGALLAD